MNATITPEITPHLFDFDNCPQALNDQGRAGWAEIIGLQAHVMLGSLLAENRALRAAHSMCDSCGEQPCGGPTFCAASREADARQNSKLRAPSRVPQDWDAMSFEELWRHFNSNRPTPQVRIEAIWYAVRQRGLDAL